MQEIDIFDLDFYDYSRIIDDPELLEKLENTYYDSEFDDWVEEFDREQKALQAQKDLELPDSETIEWSNKSKPDDLPTEEYEMGANTENITDWVKDD